MHRPRRKLSETMCIVLVVLSFAVVNLETVSGQENLPWEKDYATAVSKAKEQKRPLFVMMTATWCGPCKSLESKTLPHRFIREGLEDFVWVQAFEEKEVEEKHGCNGYPTLVFFDPTNDKNLLKTSGYESVGPFLKKVIAARVAGGLSLNPKLEELSAKAFQPDQKKLNELITSGDVEGLKKYLAPAKEDELRSSNFLVGKVEIPSTAKMDQVICTGNFREPTLPDNGLFVAELNRDLTTTSVKLIVPGLNQLEQKVTLSNSEAVFLKKFTLKPLGKKDAVVFAGRVMLPNGKPAANAIVRVLDWGFEKTDKQGKFSFDKVPPGKFVVRAEYPGGEYHEEVTFVAKKFAAVTIPLKPVTTVGIRWAVQSKVGQSELAGPDVKVGEAYFSVAHSRFSLARGAEVREYWGSDFMLAKNWKTYEKHLSSEQIEVLQRAGEEAPFFWLFDATGWPTGLHLESTKFNEIKEIASESTKSRDHFKFLRGEPVVAGQVFTLRCVRKDTFAKLEIIDVSKPLGATSLSGAPARTF